MALLAMRLRTSGVACLALRGNFVKMRARAEVWRCAAWPHGRASKRLRKAAWPHGRASKRLRRRFHGCVAWLLSRLIGRCGRRFWTWRICCKCSQVNGICCARAFPCPLQPFCLATRHTAFQNTLIHSFQQPLLLGLSVAAADVFVHQRMIQHCSGALGALSARPQ